MKVNKDKILQFDKFMSVKDIYYLLYYIVNDDNNVLYSDLDSYLIGKIYDDKSIWIWNDKISDSLLNDLDKMLIIGDNEITCNYELYNILKDKYDITDEYEIINYGIVNCVKSKSIGNVVLADLDDRIELFSMFNNNSLESDHKELTDEELLNEINFFMRHNSLYIVKDNNKIISMCCFSKLDNMVKLTRVYTVPEYRNKGYCEWLVYNVTDKLMKDGYSVILYTRVDNIAGNRAYKRIGFIEKDKLVTFNINK